MRARPAAAQDGRDRVPSPFTPLGAKGMGEGGRGGIHCVCAAIQDALRSGGRDVFVFDSCNPPQRVWEMLNGAAAVDEVEGTKARRRARSSGT